MPPSHWLARSATAVLVVGVLLAIITTRDAAWWGLHFSQLGTFGDTSSRLFNGAALAAGILLSAYGTVLAADLPSTMTRRRQRWMQISLTSAGAHLSLVGMVPIPLSPAVHDMIALGLVLSFLSLIASSVRCGDLSGHFRRFALVSLCVLLVGMALLFSHLITLAAYELMAFGTMGIWLMRLPRALRVVEDEAPTGAEVAEPCRTPSGGAHLVSRPTAARAEITATAPRVRRARPLAPAGPVRRPVRSREAYRGAIRGAPRSPAVRHVTVRR